MNTGTRHHITKSAYQFKLQPKQILTNMLMGSQTKIIRET